LNRLCSCRRRSPDDSRRSPKKHDGDRDVAASPQNPPAAPFISNSGHFERGRSMARRPSRVFVWPVRLPSCQRCRTARARDHVRQIKMTNHARSRRGQGCSKSRSRYDATRFSFTSVDDDPAEDRTGKGGGAAEESSFSKHFFGELLQREIACGEMTRL